MPTNEEGEFELVLGNRQLLSVFFIVVVLLALFFTMGYVVGRSSGPSAELASNRPPSRVIEVGPGTTKAPDPSRPSAPDPFKIPEPPRQEQPKPEPTKPEVAKPEVAKPEVAKPEVAKPEVAKVEPPKPEPPKAETKKQAEPPKPEPPKVAAVKEQPKPVAPSSGGAGRYLQVSATTKADGESLVRKLAAKGLSAITTPVPNSDLVRVLVGPIPDDEYASTKGKLAASGHADAIPRKL
jgi:outer membrane biosynthesis protein TonB